MFKPQLLRPTLLKGVNYKIINFYETIAEKKFLMYILHFCLTRHLHGLLTKNKNMCEIEINIF